MTDILKLDSISKTYPSDDGRRSTDVLVNLSLNIVEGELIMFLGPSGCGKTTLMRIVGGLEQADTGTIALDNQLLTGPDRRRGMVFQSYSSFPWLTVGENVAFGLRYLKHLTAAEKTDISNHYLELVGLSEYADFYTNRISGGMRQRVAIARTLAANPDVLLMDEPFGALDAQTREHLQLQLLEINRKEKKTTIFVTHDIDEAVLLAHRIVIFSSRPARILNIVNVADHISLDSRGIDAKETPEFFELRNNIHKIIREEHHRSGSQDTIQHGI